MGEIDSKSILQACKTAPNLAATADSESAAHWVARGKVCS